MFMNKNMSQTHLYDFYKQATKLLQNMLLKKTLRYSFARYTVECRRRN